MSKLTHQNLKGIKLNEWIHIIMFTLILLTGNLLSQQFSIPLAVTDGAESITIHIGVDPNGSDGFDAGLDTLAPPPPPAGAFDARFSWNSTDYLTDIRSNAISEKTFVMTYMVSTGNGPIVVSWDPSSLSSLGAFIVTDNVTGQLYSLDMSSTNSLDISSAGGLLDPGLRILVTPYVGISPNDQQVISESDLVLYPNYPNPFNGITQVDFYLAKSARIDLTIYNQLGQRIRNLVQGEMNPGLHQVSWDGLQDGGTAASSGIYFGILSGQNQKKAINIIYMK